MYSRDYRDIIGGALLSALGIGVAIQAFLTFDLGTFSKMGPGMFPVCLGLILAVLGVIIGFPAMFREGTRLELEWRPLVFVLLGVLGFALSIRPLGMVPAIAILTVASGLADPKQSPVGIAVLAVALSLIAYLIFHVGLGIPLVPFRWVF